MVFEKTHTQCLWEREFLWLWQYGCELETTTVGFHSYAISGQSAGPPLGLCLRLSPNTVAAKVIRVLGGNMTDSLETLLLSASTYI